MSENQIVDVKRAANSIEFIVNCPLLGDVNADGVFDYKAVKGEERAKFSTLFGQFLRDADPEKSITAMQISRHGVAQSKITVTANKPIGDIQAAQMAAVIRQRIHPDMLSEYPVVHEAELKEFEAQKLGDDYVPTVSFEDQPELHETQRAVAIVLRKILPAIRADGGNYIVDDIRLGHVDLIAEGACIACPSSIEATTRRMYENMRVAMSASDHIQTELESLNIYTPEFMLAYSVRHDGVYDASGHRQRTFQSPSP